MTERTTANLGIATQAVAFFFAWSSRAITSPPMSRFTPPTLPRTGLAAMLTLCAVSLFVASRRALGPQWSIQARTIASHRLITAGPYGVVRHPIYVAIGLFLLAACLLAATWWGLIAAYTLYVVGARLRIGAEERLLADRFGAEFETYRHRVPALLPRLRSARVDLRL